MKLVYFSPWYSRSLVHVSVTLTVRAVEVIETVPLAGCTARPALLTIKAWVYKTLSTPTIKQCLHLQSPNIDSCC